MAGKLLESARKKEQGLEKFRCWFSNPQISICQRTRHVSCTERAFELPVGRKRRTLGDKEPCKSEQPWPCLGTHGHCVPRAGSTGTRLSCADCTLSPSLALLEPLPVGDLTYGQPLSPTSARFGMKVSHPHGSIGQPHTALQPELSLSPPWH